TCRICITGDDSDESGDAPSNLFTKKIYQSVSEATKSMDDDYLLNMRFSEALESYTCIELQQNHGLPETICRKCEFQLIETLSFINRTKDTQQILNSCAFSQETKRESEESYLNEDSTYLIEVLPDEEGEVLVPVECDEKLSDSNKDNESDCEAEDAVSFLKNVKRDAPVFAAAKLKQKEIKKNHSCNYCKKRFLRKSNLVDHLRLHANVRPFECEFCNKTFVQSGNLKSHLRTHTKERPFQCLLCNKSYSQSSALKVHYRTHTNERNYGCEICLKRFTNASDLTKHKRIHDPESKIASLISKIRHEYAEDNRSIERASFNGSDYPLRPRFSSSRNANLPLDPTHSKCSDKFSKICQNKTKIFRNKILAEFRKSLVESVSDEPNFYNVVYSNEKKKLKPICQMLDAKVKVLRRKEKPFDTNGFSKLFPKVKLFGKKTTMTYKSCAIVSSAGSLTKSGLGHFIDLHDYVMRFNHAPTKGYEIDVGRKTTIRVVNSQVVSKPEFNFVNSPMFQNISIAAWDPGFPHLILICLKIINFSCNAIRMLTSIWWILVQYGDCGHFSKGIQT
ncbi:Protein glass, partial [Pseudolycoriella hygida]